MSLIEEGATDLPRSTVTAPMTTKMHTIINIDFFEENTAMTNLPPKNPLFPSHENYHNVALLSIHFPAQI
jgi:hypothetical protein